MSLYCFLITAVTNYHDLCSLNDTPLLPSSPIGQKPNTAFLRLKSKSRAAFVPGGLGVEHIPVPFLASGGCDSHASCPLPPFSQPATQPCSDSCFVLMCFYQSWESFSTFKDSCDWSGPTWIMQEHLPSGSPYPSSHVPGPFGQVSHRFPGLDTDNCRGPLFFHSLTLTLV